MGCARHGNGKRICRRCTPLVLIELERRRDLHRDAQDRYVVSEMENDSMKMQMWDAKNLLKEAAVIFKRGRYPRPLSNRITAFLEDPR